MSEAVSFMAGLIAMMVVWFVHDSSPDTSPYRQGYEDGYRDAMKDYRGDGMTIKDEIFPSVKVDARLMDDGTLWIKSDNLTEIGRVLVEDGKTYCKTFYQDAQPEPCEDDPRADVYYLAEKIGIHQLYALVVQLRGEPEQCEDAVSRKDVLDEIQRFIGYIDQDMINRIHIGLKRLSPVTPRQKTGKWIDKGDNGDWQFMTDGRGTHWHEWECDKCRGIVKVKFNYCPHCGTKMEGVKNEID